MANFKYNRDKKKDNLILLISLFLLFISISLLGLGVIGYRFNLYSISISLSVLTRYAIYFALLSTLMSLMSFGYALKKLNKFGSLVLSGAVFSLSAFIVVVFYGYVISLKSYPFMNDISTNYDEIIDFKVSNHKPIDDENRMLQLYGGYNKPYYNLKSIYIEDSSVEEVFKKVEIIFNKMNLKIQYNNRNEGIIEAQDISFWYGFHDDFIVRVERLISGVIKVDARSASRVGRSDFGKNYERIIKFYSYF